MGNANVNQDMEDVDVISVRLIHGAILTLSVNVSTFPSVLVRFE